jgi:hypothetical protein
MRTLRCIAGNILRDRILYENICNICEIQDVIRWTRIRREAWRDHVNGMDDNRLAKIAENRIPNTSGHLDGLQRP